MYQIKNSPTGGQTMVLRRLVRQTFAASVKYIGSGEVNLTRGRNVRGFSDCWGEDVTTHGPFSIRVFEAGVLRIGFMVEGLSAAAGMRMRGRTKIQLNLLTGPMVGKFVHPVIHFPISWLVLCILYPASSLA
jgi:hypothetical protein